MDFKTVLGPDQMLVPIEQFVNRYCAPPAPLPQYLSVLTPQSLETSLTKNLSSLWAPTGTSESRPASARSFAWGTEKACLDQDHWNLYFREEVPDKTFKTLFLGPAIYSPASHLTSQTSL